MKSPCLLCKSTDVTEHSCGMLRCNVCAFFFLAPEVRKEQQQLFSAVAEGELSPERLANRKNKYNQESHKKMGLYHIYAERVFPWYGKDISVLDIGASGGFFLSQLEALGAQPTNLETCEFDPVYAKLTEEIYGYKSGVGNIENWHRGRQFNLITMFDVLEHVDDFWAALKNMHTMLTPGGRLFLKLPNGRFAYLKYRIARFLGMHKKIPDYLHIRPGGHLNYWDINTIKRITKDLYELESFEYVRPTREQFQSKYYLRKVGYLIDALFRTDLFPEMIVVLKKK